MQISRIINARAGRHTYLDEHPSKSTPNRRYLEAAQHPHQLFFLTVAYASLLECKAVVHVVYSRVELT